MSDITLPEHLTAELLENALKNALSVDSLKVLNFKATFATQNGDNYTSDIFRVLVDYQLKNEEVKQKSVIVKYMLVSEGVVEMINEYKMFDKECEVYSDLLPKLSKLTNESFGPKCYYTMNDKAKIFVLEDLKDLGFAVADRQVGLDLDHSLLVAKKLGMFHAGSMALLAKNPEIGDSFCFSIFKRNDKGETNEGFVIDLFRKGLTSLLEEVVTWESFEEIAVKLEKIRDNMVEKCYESLEKPVSKFKVLNHGDLWVNNMMFKVVEDKVLDVSFVDYQIVYHSSPGFDLNYFLNTSPNVNTRENNCNEIIKRYHSTLSSTLGELNFDPKKVPTLEDIKHEVDNFKLYGLLSAVAVLPFVMMERKKDVDSSVENMMDEEKSKTLRKIQMQGKNFQAAIKPILKRFNDKGVLDC